MSGHAENTLRAFNHGPVSSKFQILGNIIQRPEFDKKRGKCRVFRHRPSEAVLVLTEVADVFVEDGRELLASGGIGIVVLKRHLDPLCSGQLLLYRCGKARAKSFLVMDDEHGVRLEVMKRVGVIPETAAPDIKVPHQHIAEQFLLLRWNLDFFACCVQSEKPAL